LAKSETKAPVAPSRPGFYLWEVPGKPVSIYLSLEALDRIQQDVMRGFGAVPKRGAEVGGILLGNATRNDRLVVEIESYEMVPIEYKRGPSYLLSEEDRRALGETLERLRADSASGHSVVGFFRSQTRDAKGLVDEDFNFLSTFFPGPDQIALLIRPFATRVGTAGFYFRENNRFQSGPPLLEFPFRRKELAPGDPGSAAIGGPVLPSTKGGRNSVPYQPVKPAPPPSYVPPAPEPSPTEILQSLPEIITFDRSAFFVNSEQAHEEPAAAATIAAEPESKPRGRTGWVWLPLSFIFLLLGVLLGFQAALTLRPQAAASPTEAFSVGLAATKDGDNLNVRWDRQSAAIRVATKGALVINDGNYHKTVDLDAAQLQTGSVVYRHSSGAVKFQLELWLGERNRLTETVAWKE
jgi:hypothetical protein